MIRLAFWRILVLCGFLSWKHFGLVILFVYLFNGLSTERWLSLCYFYHVCSLLFVANLVWHNWHLYLSRFEKVQVWIRRNRTLLDFKVTFEMFIVKIFTLLLKWLLLIWLRFLKGLLSVVWSLFKVKLLIWRCWRLALICIILKRVFLLRVGLIIILSIKWSFIKRIIFIEFRFELLIL